MASETEYPTTERALLATWRPLGCGDRLYIEANEALPDDLVEQLEQQARAMRDLVRGRRVRFMDIGPYRLTEDPPRRLGIPERRRPGESL